MTGNEEAQLIAAARAVADNGYAPYSRFRVGAAVLLSDGQIVTGCNFENASYGMTLCAEAVALGSVNALGKLGEVRAIAVTGVALGEGDALLSVGPVHPCGRCRQIINEVADLAGLDVPVICVASDGSAVEHHRIKALLPHAFGPASLKPAG